MYTDGTYFLLQPDDELLTISDEERKLFAHDDHEALLTITDVARRLGIQYRMAIELSRGDLTATYIGRRIIVRKKHLESFTRRRARTEKRVLDFEDLMDLEDLEEVAMPF